MRAWVLCIGRWSKGWHSGFLKGFMLRLVCRRVSGADEEIAE